MARRLTGGITWSIGDQCALRLDVHGRLRARATGLGLVMGRAVLRSGDTGNVLPSFSLGI